MVIIIIIIIIIIESRFLSNVCSGQARLVRMDEDWKPKQILEDRAEKRRSMIEWED